MKKSMSKALSIVLSVAMLCSSAPTSAYAGGWGHGHGHGHGRGWWFWDYIWDDGSTLEEDNGSEEQPESSDIQDESDANDPLFEDDDQPVDENQAQDGIISDPEEEEETETETETETEVSESETGEPGAETQASESETGEPGSEAATVESETGESGTETQASESETGEPGSEAATVESETGETGTETPVSESETEVASTESESETGTEVQTTESETDTKAEVLSYTQPVTAQLTADDLQVTVDAPVGAFPDGTTVTAQKVTLDDVDVNGTVLAAADITFIYGGNEVEPKDGAAVSVTIQSAEIAKADADTLSVVHVDDNNEVTPVAESDVHVRDDQVVFDASEFSVYAVVEKGSAEEDARATVNFYGKDQTTILETVYVKNADTEEELKKFVYDPGAGALDDSDIFMGWTTEKDYTRESAAADIDGVRTALADKNDIKEGDEINYYAKIATKAEVVYMAEGVVLNRFSNLVYKNSPVDVTVDTTYTPATEDQGFFGWIPEDASRGNITSAKFDGKDVAGTDQDPYAIGTVLTITGDVTLNAYAPAGHWLVFDENGKGATYHAPQFVKNGAVTVDPGEMTRVGYTFGGWYTDEKCTQKFTFGGKLAEKTIIYAKWTPIDNAAYSVVIWKQNVDGQSYDFEESIPLTATAGEKVSPVEEKNTADNAGVDASYATINNTDYKYEGFHLKSYDKNVTVNPEGDTIVNVYYDRSQYTLTFKSNETRYVKTTDSYEQTPVQYGYYKTWFWGNEDYRVLTYKDGEWGYYYNIFTWKKYTGTRYKIASLKTITALYGQNIRDQFPIVGDDGTTYNGSWTVNSTPNGKFSTGKQLTFLDTMPADNTVFTYFEYDGWYTYTFNFYLENLPGAAEKYSLAHRYVIRSDSLKSTEDEDFINLEGFTKDHSDPAYTDKVYEFPRRDSKIDFYYTRKQHSIIYQDGTCYGKETVPATKTVLKQVDGIYYEQNLASVADYTPTKTGYTFAGWYSDSTCTVPFEFKGTMPDHNIVVFAKWQQNEYRVFLHPNVDSSDESLDWGSDSQAMNFRVYDGDKISLPTGTRDEYELIGWYSDVACKNSFNEETRINTTTVNVIGQVYDQTTHMTDPMDKYGNITGTGTNSDAEKGRTWITREVNLYAKWRSKLLGAKGIHVVYDANGGSNVPVDHELYLDQAQAIAEAASTAPAGKKFDHWVVQKWDGTAYADTQTTVKPGNEFTVLKDDAKVVANEDNTEDNPSYTYTVQLKAVYVDVEKPEKTEIHWHSNVNDVLGNAITSALTKPDDAVLNMPGTNDYVVTDILAKDGTSSLEINKAVAIRAADTFSYAGMTFLGWAKTADANENELFLKWDESTGKYTTTEGTEVKEVSQVAADLKDPAGNDLYACWQGKFYIYHSGVAGDGNLQTVVMNHGQMPNGTYDLTKTVTSGTLYGGYYLDYAGKGSYKDDGKKVSDGVKYNGMNETWKESDAQTESGKAMHPKSGETYYIKEVPLYYLLPRYEYTYTMADKKIQSMFLFSAIDDLNYSGIGFVVQEVSKPAKAYRSFTVKASNGTAQAKLTPAILFAEDGLTSGGRLTEYRDDSLIKATSFTVRPYWVTMDDVTVLGSVKRTVNMGDGTINAGGISPDDQTVGAEIR